MIELNKINNIKLIISDFDGPIHDLNATKILTFKTLCKLEGMEFNKSAHYTFLVLIDQYYELNRCTDYKEITRYALEKMNSVGIIRGSKKQIHNFSEKFYEKLKLLLIPNRPLLNTLSQIKTSQQDMKCVVYTSQYSSFVLDFFSITGVDSGIFDKIYGKEEFLESKPSLSNLEKICEDYSVKPFEVIMIGDSPVQDIMPAKFLGMRTWLVSPIVDMLFDSLSI